MSENAPPLQLEQWLSMVIALPSHRSSNEGHRKFGDRALNLLYDELPARYAQDKVASDYITHMLAEVSWAVRGFSNVRDSFQAQTTAQAAHFAYKGERAREWGEFSPFTEKALGKKFAPLLFGVGGANLVSWLFPNLPLLQNSVAVLVIAYGIHLFVRWVQDNEVKKAFENVPKSALKSWAEGAKPQYLSLATRFLEKAVEVEKRFYPDYAKAHPIDIAAIVDRAFVFNSEGQSA